MSDENISQTAASESNYAEVSLYAECSPSVVTPPHQVRVHARIVWPKEDTSSVAPEIELLSPDGETLRRATMSATRSDSREEYHAEVTIERGFKPGFYDLAIFVTQRTGYYLIPVYVVEEHFFEHTKVFNETLTKRREATRLIEKNDLIGAQSILKECAESYERLKITQASAHVWADAGSVALKTSMWDAAYVFTERALDSFKALGDDRGASMCHLQLGEVHIAAGRHPLAVKHLEAAADLHKRLEMLLPLLRDYRLLLRTALWAGTAARATQYLEKQSELFLSMLPTMVGAEMEGLSDTTKGLVSRQAKLRPFKIEPVIEEVIIDLDQPVEFLHRPKKETMVTFDPDLFREVLRGAIRNLAEYSPQSTYTLETRDLGDRVEVVIPSVRASEASGGRIVEPMPKMPVCAKCGAALLRGASLCLGCGAPVRSARAAPSSSGAEGTIKSTLALYKHLLEKYGGEMRFEEKGKKEISLHLTLPTKHFEVKE